MRRLAGGRALAAAVAAVAFAGLGLAGCTSSESTAPVSAPLPTKPSFSKGEVGPLRTDTEPIAKRWPNLGTIISAQWFGGTLGDPRVPGPSTYWIDAVVELEPAAMESLRAQAGTTKPESPDVVNELVPKFPAGPFSRSGALDAAARGSFLTRAWLPATGNRLILSGMGQ